MFFFLFLDIIQPTIYSLVMDQKLEKYYFLVGTYAHQRGEYIKAEVSFERGGNGARNRANGRHLLF